MLDRAVPPVEFHRISVALVESTDAEVGAADPPQHAQQRQGFLPGIGEDVAAALDRRERAVEIGFNQDPEAVRGEDGRRVVSLPQGG